MSLQIGQINTLTVSRQNETGLYLASEGGQEVLLPKRYVPDNIFPDQLFEVFVYLDSEDRVIATTESPKAMVGQIKLLKCTDVNFTGAFLDWGLPKELLVPFAEQYHEMEVNRWYLVRLYIDKASNRIAASSRLDRFLDNSPSAFVIDQEVDLIIRNKTDLGYNAIINNAHSGLIFESEVLSSLRVGKELKGYIKNLRSDGKIDLALQKKFHQVKDELSKKILEELDKNEGFLPLNDKSKPELIYKSFSVSKANFKKAIGKLYKERLIVINSDGIHLKDN